jgi:CDP-diacylglycerol--serine O-phosphatidyltransferase
MVLKFDNYTGAFYFISLAAFFDFLDGCAARLLKAYSPIGSELDSLSDVVSFGVAPGCVAYSYLATFTTMGGLPLMAFLLPVFAALRLAKFNVDTRQKTSFLGLPVPANGLFWASLIPSIHFFSASFPVYYIPVIIIALIVLFCWLMVSEIPMFSLKFKTLKWNENQWAFSLIGIAAVVLVVFSCLGMPILSVSLIILVYIIMSLIKN